MLMTRFTQQESMTQADDALMLLLFLVTGGGRSRFEERLRLAGQLSWRPCPAQASGRLPQLTEKAAMEENLTSKYSCSKCSENFSYRTSLLLHLKSHENRDAEDEEMKQASTRCPTRQKQQEVQCIFEGCENVYSSAKDIQSHLMRRHGNRAADIADLSIVLEEGHSLKTASLKTDESDASSSSNEKKDTNGDEQQKMTKKSLHNKTCSNCGKKFQSLSKLQQHIRAHTGEKPFPCDRCPSKFSHKGHLEIHMRRHTKDKPFACNLCSSRFV